MPRVARIHQRAICYHVMNRGVNRQAIFKDAADYSHFGELVHDYKLRFDAKIYHWVWMGNHFHLLIEVAHENLRKLVGGLQQAYAQYHHARHESSGVFWQGRFKSKPVEAGSYLVSCGRYIERNPVRAGLTAVAWEYPWSSAAFYVRGIADAVTDLNPYMGAFTDRDRERYGEELRSGVEENLVRSMEGRRVFGGPAFADRLTVDRGRHRVKRGRPSKKAIIQAQSPA